MTYKGEVKMGKSFFCMLLLVGSALASSKWTCYRYVDGKPTGGVVYVYADSKNEAVSKDLKKYREELHLSVDSVECK